MGEVVTLSHDASIVTEAYGRIADTVSAGMAFSAHAR
jgi:hypothetical protein